MTITYPLSMPSATDMVHIRIRQINAVAQSVSPFTFERKVYQHTGQRWALSIDLPPFNTRALADPWIGFLASLKGTYGTFLAGDPNATATRGVGTGTPLVNGGSQTGSSLITDGWTVGQTGILKARDYIQLGSGSSSRLHMILQDANSDGSGNATFDIWPNLRSSPSDNAAITVASCKGVFALESNDYEWAMEQIPFYGMSFTASEVV